MRSLNSITRQAVMHIYETKGIKAADDKVKALLLQCETTGQTSARDRGTIKGELAEIYLEYHLLWWMEHAKNLICIKSLCMKSKESTATAEIDILLASPCKIYLFECKSFSGSKTLTNECFLRGRSSEKDVYDQSKYHLKILNEHIADCHYCGKFKSKPYKLILFELSSDETDDQRTDHWKQNIPLLTMNNLDIWLASELQKASEVQWNFGKLKEILVELNSTSEAMFNFHMKKIISRRS